MGVVKQSARFLLRRVFARILAGAVVLPCGASPERFLRLAWNAGSSASLTLEHRYRCDAQILLFGMPVAHREGVGGGSVVWREFGSGRAARLLEFKGFSFPERAAGLNRLGFIRELAHFQDDAADSIYFGLMTASQEESADEARKALHSTAKEQLYSAIQGRVGNGESETAIARFTAPSAISSSRLSELEARAQDALAAAEVIAAHQSSDGCSQSFLQTLAGLLIQPHRDQARYTYSGRRYLMRVARTEDGKAAAYFQERSLIDRSTSAIRVSGRVRRETDGKETEFRLWVPQPAERPVPLRIEYRAKSFLRLVFEAESRQ
jgi:hypothetical protein